MLVAASKTVARRCWRLWVAFGLLSGLPSCSKDNRPPLVHVEGQVFLESIPAYKAIVWFHSVDWVDPGEPRPHGVVDKQGNFVVGTYKSKDGAPAGKYRIAVYWRRPGRSGDEEGESLIPYRYMDPAQSGLPVVEVEQDPITLPAFRLATR
jgi:hypothetical protein